jgi:hypothetical protein
MSHAESFELQKILDSVRTAVRVTERFRVSLPGDVPNACDIVELSSSFAHVGDPPIACREHQIGVGLDRTQMEDTVQWQLHDRMLTGSLQQVFKSHHEHGPSWQLA